MPLKTALMIVIVASSGLLVAQAGDGPAKSTLVESMRKMAAEITMTKPDGTTPFERVEEPVYRFDDPARKFSDGTVWAYGKAGRPAALVCFSLEKRPDGHLQWVEELTAISSGKFEARLPTLVGPRRWAPTKVEVATKAISPTPPPADTEAKRLRQLRELARRFKAYEFWGPEASARNERYELRLLPQPIHRYSDPAAGIIDGAIFLFVYGTNPEIALVLEARRDAKGQESWSCELGRMAAARLHVTFDEREVADWERASGAFLTMPYDVLVVPATELEK